MSIIKKDKCIATENSNIFFAETKDSYKILFLEKDKVFQNKFGHFHHNDFIGKKYGNKVISKSKHKNEKEGFVIITDFIPSYFDKATERLTQILFNPDISLILSLLNIRSDHIILESGTGSGCLSINIANCLKEGHLYTFEFNSERCDKLKKNFNSYKIENITIINQDVIEDGFKLTVDTVRDKDISNYKQSLFKKLDNQIITNDYIQKLSNEGELFNGFIDSVFIDLPNPWMAIENIKKKLKKNGNLVSFSPCIEQVTKTIDKMKQEGFINPRTFEIPYRYYNYVKNESITIPQLTHLYSDSSNIKLNEQQQYDILINTSRKDMRGHTGFLIHGVKQ